MQANTTEYSESKGVHHRVSKYNYIYSHKEEDVIIDSYTYDGNFTASNTIKNVAYILHTTLANKDGHSMGLTRRCLLFQHTFLQARMLD
jgi:phage terminase large subunit GpA-like protein